MPMCNPVGWCGCVMTAILLVGCLDASRDPAFVDHGPPSDFAIRIYVVGRDDADQPARQTAQYVVESDRTFRFAAGAGVGPQTFPPPIVRLSPAQMTSLWGRVQRHHLLAEPTSPRGQRYLEQGENVGVLYRVSLSARGRVHEYTTTAVESPPTMLLMRYLLGFRGQSP